MKYQRPIRSGIYIVFKNIIKYFNTVALRFENESFHYFGGLLGKLKYPSLNLVSCCKFVSLVFN